ncbi:hypothetical protein PGTUg99_000231 [Puccinia graminis f. sp. tritici]|uniref:Uncharacterized protein n=1 Tax=Puccinia graminis f. sp. tritici TaxID=56615 RepID=A0A5B0M937_PUCGR|nr:hypothetical protein PGTUg99_000231 [Puccinia graminis f. sp. tritici]
MMSRNSKVNVEMQSDQKPGESGSLGGGLRDTHTQKAGVIVAVGGGADRQASSWDTLGAIHRADPDGSDRRAPPPGPLITYAASPGRRRSKIES